MGTCEWFVASGGLLLGVLAGLPAASPRGLAGQPDQPKGEGVRLRRAYDRIDRFLTRDMKKHNTPGLALAVTSREGTLLVVTRGFADRKTRRPVRPGTLFEIGSLSKSFTAVALLQLRDEGKFDPRQPVKHYLKWFEIGSKYAPITGHHLLTHTAGLPIDRDDVPSSLSQTLALRDRAVGYAPGKRYAYSNIGYQVLGQVLEEITGQEYPEVLRARLLRPLGMKASAAAITHALRPRLAVGYEPAFDDRPAPPDHPLAEAVWVEYGAGDGSVSATAADLAAYLRMLLNRGVGPKGRVLSEEGFRLLVQKAIPAGGGAYYGYGLRVLEEDGHTLIRHRGGMLGYRAELRGDLTAGLGVVVLTNGPGDFRPAADFALAAVRAALEKRPLPALPEAREPARCDHAGEYAGTYATAEGKTLVLKAKGRRLLLSHRGEEIALEPRGDDCFYVNHPDFALFLLEFGRRYNSEPFPAAAAVGMLSAPAGPLLAAGALARGAGNDTVVEVSHGGDWYVNKAYQEPRTFTVPAEWQAYPGHYRSQQPWLTNFRVVLRKGQLWYVHPKGEETAPLLPLRPGVFQVGAGETAERLSLDRVVKGKAQRANFSGVDYYRFFRP
jgi:CubicO group peptidase (beta-lactamase class C family)